MNIITGYLSPTEGSITVDGFDTLENPLEAKKRIGYLPEIPPLYTDMTVKEYLNFMYDLKKVKLPRKEHIAEICSLVKIDDVYGRLIANLSKGYRQRVGIAQALLGNPPVLILDEPTVGLDPKQIIEIRNLIKSLGRKHTVILSSHILSEVQAVCERVIVINRGSIVADGTPDSLAHSLSNENRLLLRMEGEEKAIKQGLHSLRGVKEVDAYGEKEPNDNGGDEASHQDDGIDRGRGEEFAQDDGANPHRRGEQGLVGAVLLLFTEHAHGQDGQEHHAPNEHIAVDKCGDVIGGAGQHDGVIIEPIQGKQDCRHHIADGRSKI